MYFFLPSILIYSILAQAKIYLVNNSFAVITIKQSFIHLLLKGSPLALQRVPLLCDIAVILCVDVITAGLGINHQVIHSLHMAYSIWQGMDSQSGLSWALTFECCHLGWKGLLEII